MTPEKCEPKSLDFAVDFQTLLISGRCRSQERRSLWPIWKNSAVPLARNFFASSSAILRSNFVCRSVSARAVYM